MLSLPLSGEQSIELTPTIEIEGRPLASQGSGPIVDLTVATANYFRVLGIPQLEGSDLSGNRPGGTSPNVGVINQEMAQRFWPNESAVGREGPSELWATESIWRSSE